MSTRKIKAELGTKGLNRLVSRISQLNSGEDAILLSRLLLVFSEERKQKWVNLILYLASPKSRWSKVEVWMEAQFRKDMKRLPIKVASMSVHYFKIDSRMFPFLIKMAQRIKNTVRMRKKREAERLEEKMV